MPLEVLKATCIKIDGNEKLITEPIISIAYIQGMFIQLDWILALTP